MAAHPSLMEFWERAKAYDVPPMTSKVVIVIPGCHGLNDIVRKYDMSASFIDFSDVLKGDDEYGRLLLVDAVDDWRAHEMLKRKHEFRILSQTMASEGGFVMVIESHHWINCWEIDCLHEYRMQWDRVCREFANSEDDELWDSMSDAVRTMWLGVSPSCITVDLDRDNFVLLVRDVVHRHLTEGCGAKKASQR